MDNKRQSLKVYKIADGELWWYIAKNPEDAYQCHAENHGCINIKMYLDSMWLYPDEIDCRLVPDDEVLTIEVTTKTFISQRAKDWVRQRERGFLAVTGI